MTMGRPKLSVELRINKKARRVTFKKKRKILEKKAYELSTLCGIKIGMILYGPAKGDELVMPIINFYKKRSDDGCKQI